MPEGPEIRTVADKVRPYLLSKIITDFYTGERAKTLGFHNLKCPVTIIGVRSHGKKVLIDLDSGHLIIASFGMAGRLQWTKGDHSHIRFDLSTAEMKGPFRVMKFAFSLFFQDPRYMGGIDIIPNANIPLYFKDIGPDLLQHALDEKTWIPLDTWVSIFVQKKYLKWKVADVLVEQCLVACIGNYLRAEILYYAGVNPERLVETITRDEWDRIRICSHRILLVSYSYGGFTIESFISPDGERGLYPAAVYGRTHDALGNPVVTGKGKNGQTLHYVPAVQK
jgi:formamidopyrimidine-DNA glycosylase